MTTNLSNTRRLGFTLIELLVVIVILAALAALIVPNIGMFGRSTDMSVSAKSQADIANQLNQFFILQKRYPQGMDSLLNLANDAVYYEGVSGNNQTYGFPANGADGTNLGAQISVGTPLTGPWRRSMTRAGFDWVYDHDTTVIDSNQSNTTRRDLVDPIPVAEVTNTPGAGAELLAKILPQGLSPRQRVIALGFGQKNSAIGKTATTTPLYPGADKTYYGRYICYFMIYESGERATLVGVSDAYGRTPDFTQQQFNESLPDGVRQG